MSVDILLAFMYMHCVHARFPQKSVSALDPLEWAGVTDSLEQPRWFWQPNTGPLEEL